MTDLAPHLRRAPVATLDALLAGARVWTPGDRWRFEDTIRAELDRRREMAEGYDRAA